MEYVKQIQSLCKQVILFCCYLDKALVEWEIDSLFCTVLYTRGLLTKAH